jgi:cytoskeletal protein CcmA (bactofilin family)
MYRRHERGRTRGTRPHPAYLSTGNDDEVLQQATHRRRARLARLLRPRGDIETDGTVRIDGRLNGSVRRAGSVIVGTESTIQGGISAAEVVIGGTVQGNIVAVERVELQASAIVNGNIEANSILIHEGSAVNGKLNVRSREIVPRSDAGEPSGGLALATPMSASAT